MNKSAKGERTGTAVAAAEKRIILSMGGKGGVGKTSVMTGLAEWFVENEIPVTLLDLDTEIATAESLRRERDMIDRVNRGIGRCSRLGGGEKFIASDRLRSEQKRVVEFVLDSRDHVVAISGAAGTGKTATLQELRRGLLEARREVLAVAPTMSAVEELQKVGFTDAMTLERLLQDRTAQQALRQKVLILDEAGMVSGRQMTEFLRLADERDARVVFSGDTRQIQSVEACDALRILEKESRLKSIALTQVQRQTQLDYRDAIQELRRDPERGLPRPSKNSVMVREVCALRAVR